MCQSEDLSLDAVFHIQVPQMNILARKWEENALKSLSVEDDIRYISSVNVYEKIILDLDGLQTQAKVIYKKRKV